MLLTIKSGSFYWFAALLFLSGCYPADHVGAPEPELSVATIPDSAQWIMSAEATGRPYQIQISLPLDYDGTTIKYPAIYLLDANGQFGMATEIVRNLTYFDEDSPGLIVVGVGYPVGQFFNALDPRNFDLTPDRDIVWEDAMRDDLEKITSRRNYPAAWDDITGGADEFLTFLNQELIPHIESDFRVDSTDRTLIGHSLGGLFALHTLLEQPDSFDKYLVISPSLWWDCDDDLKLCWTNDAPDGLILRRETELSESGWSPNARMYMTVGSDEAVHMVDGPTRLAERLKSRNYPDFDWTFEVMTNEWHMSVVPGAISNGLRWLHFGTPDL